LFTFADASLQRDNNDVGLDKYLPYIAITVCVCVCGFGSNNVCGSKIIMWNQCKLNN